MDNVQGFVTAITSYIVAIYAMFLDSIVSEDSAVLAVLGFILLIARLTIEVKRLYELFVRKKDGGE